MSKRGWGGPSIREGSHPPPYMTLQADNKNMNQLLDHIESVMKNPERPDHEKLQVIAALLETRPPHHWTDLHD